METTKSIKIPFTVIFITLAIFASALLYQSYIAVKSTYLKSSEIIEKQNQKRNLLTTMYRAARERSIVLLRMHIEKDAFELDEMNQKLGAYARKFIKAREELKSLALSNSERSGLARLNESTSYVVPIQNKVAELFLEEKHSEASDLLVSSAIPGQNITLNRIDNIIRQYEHTSAEVLVSINEEYERVSKNFRILGIIIFVGGILFFSFKLSATRRESKTLRKLLDEQKHITNKLDESSRKLSYQATHDDLTGLINRHEFRAKLLYLLGHCEEDKAHVVAYLDLDQFKVINDTCGHISGDEFLREIAIVIKSYIRKSDTIARLGGDEFGIIFENCELAAAEKNIKSIIKAVDEFRYMWERKTFRVGVSVGIIQISDTDTDVDDIIRKIDSACYAAKDAGRGCYYIYKPDDKELTCRELDMDWSMKIDLALEEKRFVLYAQPIVSTRNNRSDLVNYEILVRIRGHNNELLSPSAFIPPAERYNRMARIDRWVVSETLKILSNNRKELNRIGFISINLSCQSLTDASFLGFVIDCLGATDTLADKICFEITETAAIINVLQASRYINTLRGMGVRFALDDFGSGLSSFGYLKTLPVDYIKIDGLFVKNISDEPADHAMVKAIHDISKVMGLQTIAEYVESKDTLLHIEQIGIEYAQGYEMGSPAPVEEMIAELSPVVSKVAAKC